jgi:hypothetical protein
VLSYALQGNWAKFFAADADARHEQDTLPIDYADLLLKNLL